MKPQQPRIGELLLVWITLGAQSFGGGSSTFYLIHKASIERGWMTESEFLQTWALAQISPGINLVKLTALIGYKLRGWPGVVTTMAGLLIPSATVTVLMTAGFSVIRGFPLVQAAMRGILPATIGLSLANGVRMGLPLLTQARNEGRLRLSANVGVASGAALLMSVTSLSPLFILLLAGIATAVLSLLIPIEPPRALKTDRS